MGRMARQQPSFPGKVCKFFDETAIMFGLVRVLCCCACLLCLVMYAISFVKGFAYVKGVWSICKQHPRFLPRSAGFPREPETFALEQVSCQFCLWGNIPCMSKIAGQKLSRLLKNCIVIFPQNCHLSCLAKLCVRSCGNLSRRNKKSWLCSPEVLFMQWRWQFGPSRPKTLVVHTPLARRCALDGVIHIGPLCGP